MKFILEKNDNLGSISFLVDEYALGFTTPEGNGKELKEFLKKLEDGDMIEIKLMEEKE